MMQPSEAAGVNVMAEALVSAGALSREAAARMLAAEVGEGGAQSAAQVNENPNENPDTHPDAETEARDAGGHSDHGDTAHGDDATSIAAAVIDPLFAPPAAPQDYRFEMRPSTGMQPAHLRSVQQWCHGARLPLPIAQSLYSEVERSAGNAAPLAPAEVHARNAQGLAELRRAWGERTGAMLGLGRRLVAEVGQAHPDLIDFLEASGAGSNPRVVRQLAEHAARIYAQPHGEPKTKGGHP